MAKVKSTIQLNRDKRISRENCQKKKKKHLSIVSPPLTAQKTASFSNLCHLSVTHPSGVFFFFFREGGNESLSFLIKGATRTGNRVRRNKAAGAEEEEGGDAPREGV